MTRRRPRDLESAEQRLLVQWAALAALRSPELALLFAIPNGGHRHAATAGRLKAEGVQPGVPDLCLPVPRGEYAGLWIELKPAIRKGEKKRYPSKHQRAWLDALTQQGYRAVACWGWEQARAEIERYMALPLRQEAA